MEIVVESQIDGVIATNTTISRSGLKTHENKVSEIGNGGLSGKPLEQRSTEVISYLDQRAKGRFKIIGVGGIHDVESAKKKLDAGSSLIQIYSGFIFEGPSLVKQILKGIRKN